MYAQKKGVYYIQVNLSSLFWDKFSSESPEIMLLDTQKDLHWTEITWSHNLKWVLSMLVMVYGEVIWGGHCLTVSEVESNLSYVTYLKKPSKKEEKESTQLNYCFFLVPQMNYYWVA